MFDNDVWAFTQSSLYYAFLQGGVSGTGLYKNEILRLCRTSQFGDRIQIATMVANYTSSSNLSIIILHLEGEEVFGLAKCKVDLPPKLRAYSHQHDWLNFFHPIMANAMTSIN
jgi:hypothetical protein